MSRSLLVVFFLVMTAACRPRQGHTPSDGPHPAPARVPSRALWADAGTDEDDHKPAPHPHFQPKPGDVQL